MYLKVYYLSVSLNALTDTDMVKNEMKTETQTKAIVTLLPF